MSDHEGGGGSDIDVPKIGPVNKKVVLAVGGAGAAYVLWRYWRARSAPADTGAEPGFGDGGTIPAVAGGGLAPGGGGIPSNEPPSTSTYGFTGKTNSQWTQYTATQLSQSDRWSYTDIVTALGAFIGNRPLDATQTAIVQAAIAMAGYPPEGSHVIVPGGDVALTVAPSGLSATVLDTTTIQLKWTPVPGAASYRVYRSGSPENVNASLDGEAKIGGLQPGTSYKFSVAAFTASGKGGPQSGSVSATTKKVSLAAPTGLTAEKITNTTVIARWKAVPGATYYRIYTDKASENVGSATQTRASWQGLHANTSYRLHVRAVDNTGTYGPPSNVITVKTKK